MKANPYLQPGNSIYKLRSNFMYESNSTGSYDRSDLRWGHNLYHMQARRQGWFEGVCSNTLFDPQKILYTPLNCEGEEPALSTINYRVLHLYHTHEMKELNRHVCKLEERLTARTYTWTADMWRADVWRGHSHLCDWYTSQCLWWAIG